MGKVSDEAIHRAAELSCRALSLGDQVDRTRHSWYSAHLDDYSEDKDFYLKCWTTDKHFETAFLYQDLSKAVRELQTVRDEHPNLVEKLRLSSPTAPVLDFGYCTYEALSYFEAAHTYAIHRTHCMDQWISQSGHEMLIEGKDSSQPLSKEFLRAIQLSMCVHMWPRQVPSNLYELVRDCASPSPRLQILKEAQRATGTVPPFADIWSSEKSESRQLHAETQSVIDLINQGYDYNTIQERTGKTPNNISQIKRRYSELIHEKS